MRECWKRLPGTPNQLVQDTVLGALGTKRVEGHDGEWRTKLYVMSNNSLITIASQFQTY